MIAPDGPVRPASDSVEPDLGLHARSRRAGGWLQGTGRKNALAQTWVAVGQAVEVFDPDVHAQRAT